MLAVSSLALQRKSQSDLISSPCLSSSCHCRLSRGVVVFDISFLEGFAFRARRVVWLCTVESSSSSFCEDFATQGTRMGGEGEEHVGTSEVVPEVVPEVEPEASEPGLKYLEFLRVAVINGTAYAVKLYNYGKDNSGSLKPSVDSVEGHVRTVTGPLAHQLEEKFPGVLQFVDKKVDEGIQYLDIILPQTVKDRSSQAFDVARDAAKQAPDAARAVVGQVQEQGVYNTASNYYTKFQPVAESYGSQAWQTLMSLPLAPQAAGTARIGAEKLNHILVSLRDSQLPLSAYVPLLPLNYFEKTPEEQSQFKVK